MKLIKQKSKWIVLLLLFMGAVAGGCSGCSSEDPTPDPDPTPGPGTNPDEEEVYDLKITDMRVRDPFIFVDHENQRYYLHVNGDKKVKYYKSKDLLFWKDMGTSFQPTSDFWGKEDFWAPDLYLYKGKYYLFITLSAPGINRGTSILVADSSEGPFQPLVNKAATPSEKMALDGSLFVDKDGTPWILYCHEWLEVGDGKVVAQKLTADLTTTEGEPHELFTATSAPWVGSIESQGVTGYVTDAPFIHQLDNGELVMLWSSFAQNGKYAIGQATSKSGSVLGPWEQSDEPLNNDDGGHAMLFKDIKGRLMISYHAPNSGTETPTIKEAYINNGKIVIGN